MEAFDNMLANCRVMPSRNPRDITLETLAERYPMYVNYLARAHRIAIKFDFCMVYIVAKADTYSFSAYTHPNPRTRELFVFDAPDLSKGLDQCTALIAEVQRCSEVQFSGAADLHQPRR